MYQKGNGSVESQFKNYSRSYVENTPNLQMDTKTSSSNISHVDNNCCKAVTIVLELSPHGENFLSQLKKMWNMVKRCNHVIYLLHQHLNVCPNPYEEVLRLVYNCQEFNCPKNKSLPFFIIEEFKQWIIASNHNIQHLLTKQLKVDVFKIICRQNSITLNKIIVEIYEMQPDQDLFVDIIKCMIDKKMYREACQSTILLELQKQFGLKEFVIPLILQDKLFTVDEFLSTSPSHQPQLVAYLDSVLGHPSGIKDSMAAYIGENNIPGVKLEKLHTKPWKKMIARFLKMFKLSNDLTPNFNKKRNEGALQFLFHKRFVDKTFGDESWKEMVQEAVGDDEELQKELVLKVSIYGDISEALYWAQFYKVDQQFWPHNVKLFHENPEKLRLPEKEASHEQDDWDDVVEIKEPVLYHKYPMLMDTIHVVNTSGTFGTFLDYGLQDVDIVGIDCEWKPSFAGQKNELALLQIATRHKVFILDVVQIGTTFPYLWQKLGKFLFNNCDILKLGFGLTSDLAMIKKTLPDVNITHKMGFLDLLAIYKQLGKYQNIVLPFESQLQSCGPSLSTLVLQCFGCPLDKSEQFSNWEKRPLRESQLEYAALDAYCLIQIYDVLNECCSKGGFAFDEICYNIMSNERMTKKKSKKNDQNAFVVQNEKTEP